MSENTVKSAEISQISSPKLKLNYRQSIVQTKKRIRALTALQGPKGRYNNYADAKINWKQIFEEISAQSQPAKIYLETHYPKINYKTFHKRFKEWNDCGQLEDGIGDDRGGHNAAMTVEQEKLLATYIKIEYLSKKKCINSTDLKEIARNFYKSIHPNNTRSSPIFKCGSAWIQRFMKKYGFYNSNGRIVKQPQISDRTNAAAKYYLAQCNRAYIQYGSNLLFTMDETFWPLVAKQQQLVREHNNSEFKPSTNIDIKQGVTLVVTVAANGDKLPLYVVGEGKTTRCTIKFKIENNNQLLKTTYSESGWVTEEVMLKYLKDIIVPVSNGRPCGLMLDSYAAHKTEQVYEFAKQNNIELIVVPACMTSTLAPLDVGINSVLKSTYSQRWRQVRLFEEELTTIKCWEQAIVEAEFAYKNVKRNCIKNSFKKAVSFPPMYDNLLILIAEEEKAKIDLERIPAKKKKEKLLKFEIPTRISSRILETYNDDYTIARQFQNDIYEHVDDE